MILAHRRHCVVMNSAVAQKPINRRLRPNWPFQALIIINRYCIALFCDPAILFIYKQYGRGRTGGRGRSRHRPPWTACLRPSPGPATFYYLSFLVKFIHILSKLLTQKSTRLFTSSYTLTSFKKSLNTPPHPTLTSGLATIPFSVVGGVWRAFSSTLLLLFLRRLFH